MWFVFKPQCSNELFDQGHRESKHRNLVLLPRVSFQNMVYKGTKFTSWEMTERVLLVELPINDRDHLLYNLTVISFCLNAKAGGAELIPAGEKLCLLQGNHKQAFTPGKTFTQSICSQGHGEQTAYLLSPEAKHQGKVQSWKMCCSTETTCLSQVTKLHSPSKQLTRQETWGLMPTADGNYLETGRNKRE